MRNLGNYTPAARTSHVHGMSDVFRAPDGGRDRGERWVKTSVSLRADTRMRLKRHAAAHDMKPATSSMRRWTNTWGKGL